jgi:hypothetical protein
MEYDDGRDHGLIAENNHLQYAFKVVKAACKVGHNGLYYGTVMLMI